MCSSFILLGLFPRSSPLPCQTGILLDLGTRTSRLPQFRRRCEEILSRTSSKRSNGTSASSGDTGALARQPSTGGSRLFFDFLLLISYD
jgi:hypothetical protein